MTILPVENSVTSKSKSDLAELIRTRRSISVFRAEPIPEGLVAELLESAVYAPNHRLTQPWRFVSIVGEGVRRYAEIRREMALPGFQKLTEAQREQAAQGTYHKFATVPAYLIVIMVQNADPEIAEEDYAACAALIQNFLLLAWDRGLGTCWKTFKSDPTLRAWAGIQPYEKVVGIIHLGYPDHLPTSARHSIADRLTVID